MVRPRSSSSANRTSTQCENLSALSSGVLKLRLQALNLPITGSRGQLLARLEKALPGNTSKTSVRTQKKTSLGTKAVQTRHHRANQATDRQQSAQTANRASSRAELHKDESEDNALSDEASSSSIDEMFERDKPEPPASQSQTTLSSAQRAAIEEIVAESISNALVALRAPESSPVLPPADQHPRTPGMASPLGLSRPVECNLEEKILRESLALPRHSASTSTSPPVGSAITATTCMCAVAVIPAVTSPYPAPSNHPATQVPPSHPHPASVARSKVRQLRRRLKPQVSTPIDIYRLELELANHPDRNFVSNLLSTLKEGARIGYSGPRSSRVSPNLISATQHPEVVTLNLQKEVTLGRVAGPYPLPPLPNFQCHPVDVVPKKHSTKWRTIYHLSYPPGDSINDHIPKGPFCLSYVRVDNAIHILQSLGKGAFMAKPDLKSAFRLIPIHPNDWSLLGVYRQSQYYVDMYLPFGVRPGPFLFNLLSDGLEWILKHNYGLQYVIHILDDFFIAERTKLSCLSSFSTLLRVFMSLKAPVVVSKTIGPSQVVEFIGIVLDSVRMEACLPQNKLTRINELLTSFKKTPLRALGRASFSDWHSPVCMQGVVPGRTFLQRTINLTRGVPSRFHHVRLNREFFKDLDMWKVFLTKWNGRSFFLESSTTPAPDIELHTDAASMIGFGGFLQGRWFQGHWPPHMRLNKDQGISIEWQELFPIVVACAIWHPFFTGKRLQFWCDNESVVAIINSGHSKAPRVMDLVRFLVLISMKHNFLVRARHVSGVSNNIADALSRFQMQRFRALAPDADQNPCTIPPSLMTL